MSRIVWEGDESVLKAIDEAVAAGKASDREDFVGNAVKAALDKGKAAKPKDEQK